MIARNLKRWMLKQMFDPTLIGILVNPFYLARRDLARAMRRFAGWVQGRVLDVGCGQKPYMHFFSCDEYVGVEIDSPRNRLNKNADHFYDGRHLPFDDREFDTVLCSQVLEHVFEPDAFVAELNRVLKPGGTLLLTTPFVWDEHEQPYDYARYSSFGLRHLLARHQFETQEELKTLSDASILFQLSSAYMYKITRTRSRVLNMLCTMFLMAPLNAFGALLGRVLPRNADLYLDNVVVSRKQPDEGAGQAAAISAS